MTHSALAKLSLYVSCCAVLLGAHATPARADVEPLDTTRLDVERLPPEALPLTRSMYHLGFHVRAELGAQGFAYGVGRITAPGFVAHVALGYEFTEWFLIAVDFGLGMHGTNAPPPPAAATLQTYTALGQVRFTLPIGVRVGLWLSGDAGVGTVSGDVLQAYGYRQAGALGAVYGGALGFDWHFLNPHHAIGVKAAAHLYPQLAAADNEKSLALEGTAYLKYAF